MAIFYNHIKGCGVNSTGSVNSTTDLWTWIKWGDATLNDPETGDGVDGNIIGKYYNYLPKIYLNYTNTFPTDEDYCLGHIITSSAINQKIENNFTFKQNVVLEEPYGLEWNISPSNKPFLVCCEIDGNDMLWMHHPTNIEIESKKTKILGKVILSDTTTIDAAEKYTVHTKGEVKIDHCLYVGPDSEDSFDPTKVSTGTIKAQNKCEALYFNATSDRRAKENITPVQFSALATVNSLPIYSFNYLSQPEAVTIGLIAQEAAEYNLDGFNMVDNLDASGRGSDMMQMKESKLIYVLWKAVQELSAEVEELKAEIRNLK